MNMTAIFSGVFLTLENERPISRALKFLSCLSRTGVEKWNYDSEMSLSHILPWNYA